MPLVVHYTDVDGPLGRVFMLVVSGMLAAVPLWLLFLGVNQLLSFVGLGFTDSFVDPNAPWLAVVFVDWYLRRGQNTEPLLFDTSHRNLAGPLAMFSGIVVSIVLFSNQVSFTGFVAQAVPQIGDIAFEVGFVVSAAIYFLMRRSAPAR